jgi:glucans biosynthesis protein
VGAAEFLVTPGAATVVEVRLTAVFRNDVRVTGIAPITSMFWYGENAADRFGDFRPEVHDSDGALIHTGAGEWLWRPLVNETNRLRWSSFADVNPRGFGLLQRDRKFTSYEDLEALYHIRPSVWIEPTTNGWGEGEIRLVETPSTVEYGDNINLFYVPRKPARAGDRIEYAYRIHWYVENPEWPPLGRALSTRMAEISYNRRAMRFILEFSRPPHAPDVPQADIRVDLAVDRARILGSFLQRNDYANTWRTFFDVEALSTNLPAELRCSLRTEQGPLTETWVYQWMHPRF